MNNTLPFARLNIVANQFGAGGRSYVHVVVDGKPVAQLPVTKIGLEYDHNGAAVVTVGLFRADLEFHGLLE